MVEVGTKLTKSRWAADVCLGGKPDVNGELPPRPLLTQLYGPAVHCKLNQRSGDWSCSSVSGPCVEQIAPGHHGYPRASDLILG